MSVSAHAETIDVDLLVAEFLARRPDRLWSLSDVLYGLHRECELGTLRDAVRTLVGLSLLDEVAEVVCDDHRDGFWGDECTDPLCGDTLFTLPSP